MIDFPCACGELLAASDEDAGLRMQCPKCGDSVTVPELGYHFEQDPAHASEPRRPLSNRLDPSSDGRQQARQMMTKARAELAEDTARREQERRLVVFTPGIIGGTAAFVICSTLAVVSILLYNLYLAIGLTFFAIIGLFRAVLSFIGRGVD